MSALRRVLGAPVLWGSLVVFHWVVAAAFAGPISVMVRAALGSRHAVHDPGHLLPATLELFADNPSLAPAIAVAIASASILSALVWFLSAGGVIRRLGGERGLAAGIAASLRHAPGLAVMAFMGLIPRALVLVNLAVDVFSLGPGIARGLLILGLWSLCSAGEGMARAQVVLDGASPYDPRRALLPGYRAAVRAPKIWLATALLTAAGAAVTVLTLMCVTRGLGAAWGLWAARGLGIIGIGLALWRTAIFVDAVQRGPTRP